jgi:DNA-binding Xre family transcriptional regulator
MTKKRPRLKIRKALDEWNVSQYELAQRLELQTQHTTKMVKTEYNPTFKTLVRIAEAIGCSVSDLIDE